MKTLLTTLAAAIALIILISANCNKGTNCCGNGSQTIVVTIAGKVLDQDKFPLAGVQVEGGGQSSVTGLNGSFELSNGMVNKDVAVVKLSKPGFFTGYRTFTPTANSKNNIAVTLIRKNVSGSFASGPGGTLAVNNGGSINFPANAVVNQSNNAAYSGNVTVSAYFINPTASDFRSILPGDLRGTNSAGEQVGLQSFGMMAVELEGSGGEKLQLATGKQATITFPIPAAMMAQAPTSIPLWFFDEATGLWKQEGSATKQGSTYIGSVNHFSFWNVDAPYKVIHFDAVVKDQQNNAVPRAGVEIKMANGVAGYGITDDNGKVGGLIPANEALKFLVNTECSIDSINIGPFSANTDLGVVHVNVNHPNVAATISGNVLNCSGGAVTNGFVNILAGGNNHRTNISNGTFSFTLQKCNNNPMPVQLVATDAGANKQSNPVNLTVTSGNVNAGQISTCITLTNFINFTVNGTTTLMTPPSDSLSAVVQFIMQTRIDGFNMDSTANRSFRLGFLADRPSTVPIQLLSIVLGNKYYVNIDITSLPVTLTEFGTSGQYIAGNFSGNVRDSTAHINVPMSCSFRVRRY